MLPYSLFYPEVYLLIMAKFFFCHSPFAILPKGAVGFIYRFDRPRFFSIITAINDDHSFEDQNAAGYSVLFEYHRGDGHSQFYCIQLMQNIDRATAKMHSALFEAAAWYCNYLNHEDHKKYGKKSSWSYMQDFSLVTKGLQILRMPKLKKYLISYPDGLKTVNSDRELDSFLVNALRYPSFIIDTKEGIINTM